MAQGPHPQRHTRSDSCKGGQSRSLTCVCVCHACHVFGQVEYHQAYAETAPRKSQVEPVGTGSGWCLKEDKGTQYLIRVGGRPASSHHHRHEQDHHGHTSKAGAFHHGATGAGDGSTTDTDGDAEYWYELTDDNGDLYYFNTGKSRAYIVIGRT